MTSVGVQDLHYHYFWDPYSKEFVCCHNETGELSTKSYRVTYTDKVSVNVC